MNTHVVIVLSRYMMLSVAQRENKDDRTICELCFCLLDEMEDITFSLSMGIILEALMEAWNTSISPKRNWRNLLTALSGGCPDICRKHQNGQK